MTRFEDITVVVQGPVQTFQDREQEAGITQKCLESVRTYLPGATVILSTWPDQELDGLDYDELVISPDPGPNIRNFHKDGSPQYYNNNRQIVSTLAGLKQVKTPYAIKLRSDNFLTGNAFVALQQQFPERGESLRFLRERVVVSNVFTRRYAKGFQVAFHLSDFFYYGLTEDLLRIWDLQLLEDLPLSQAASNRGGPGGFPIDCTQMFWLRTLNKVYPDIRLTGLLDNRPEVLAQSDQCYANNLVIGSPEDIGLGLCQKFSGNARIARTKGKCAQWQFFEWKDLYRRYCQPDYRPDVTALHRLKLFLTRLIHVFPTRLETSVRLRKG
ncbi:WavE lipopolysaccharide synthesis family protein [Marinobacter mobilis]|uniref:WavE lipopolysaccharide synthesis n=1 Tax=Marinobacter mobilis TaxID=488533 RepID=A0A1H3AXS5_9GAMM|nr:WavE lipopolysaccharide synthesis family protein [Marinobacter mobilis]SDX34211.1 WavE lipopolysaccharide synthesis [Marinobacter mobilis]